MHSQYIVVVVVVVCNLNGEVSPQLGSRVDCVLARDLMQERGGYVEWRGVR